MKLIGLTLVVMVATSCLVRSTEGVFISSAVAAAGLGGALSLGAAGLGGAATITAAVLKTETGGRALDRGYNSASNRASRYYNRASRYFWG